MARRVTFAWAALALAMAAGPALASGPGTVVPWYIDPHGGEAKDLARRFDGQVGVVMARAPRPILYVDWRLLHGQAVGPAAGRALSIPCCDPPGRWNYAVREDGGVQGWLAARKLIPGTAEVDWLQTEREGPNYTQIPNCFDEAFDTATATLKDRAARYGAGSEPVKAWLAGQDAVFAACHETGQVPAPLTAGAPEWLRADRAYQAAALALYDQRFADAAAAFAEIARDRASPWRASAPYLRVRALTRPALNGGGPETFAAARAAMAAFRKLPAATYGRAEVVKLERALAYRDRPAERMAELDRELARREAPADIAVSFRDYAGLHDKGVASPDALDWIATIRARPDAKAMEAAYAAEASDAAVAALQIRTRLDSLARARERWTKGRDPAWLIAALSLADPDDPQAAGLAAEVDRVAADHPAWLTAQYHALRLRLANTPASESRSRLDAILQRQDLSVSDRNIFGALRGQVASDPKDFARLALRQRVCADETAQGCVRGFWQTDAIQEGGIYDGAGGEGARGLGADARAVIDRLPLSPRIALSRDPQLPAQLRLDVALTSFARAVVLADDAAADGLARDLEDLLPQMRTDFQRARTAPAGREKRFAQFFVFAKIPGLRTDLADYVRPEGTVAQFQQYWIDWMMLPPSRPQADARLPLLAPYQSAGIEPDSEARVDLACLGECGLGAAPLRLPDFAAAGLAQAKAERGYFVPRSPDYGGDPQPAPPGGAISMWEEILAFAQANPTHPQVPEALYWMVRVGRFGGSHDHSGRRAFQLLHAKYPATTWAKRSPYYYD